MFNMPADARFRDGSMTAEIAREKLLQERSRYRLLDDELLDLYGAIAIAVPAAFLVKLLWG